MRSILMRQGTQISLAQIKKLATTTKITVENGLIHLCLLDIDESNDNNDPELITLYLFVISKYLFLQQLTYDLQVLINSGSTIYPLICFQFIPYI